MAAKPDEDDKERKHLASEASSTLGSLKSMSEKAWKMSGLVVKSPNAEAMKTLVSQIEDILDDADELKKSLKDMKALTK